MPRRTVQLLYRILLQNPILSLFSCSIVCLLSKGVSSRVISHAGHASVSELLELAILSSFKGQKQQRPDLASTLTRTSVPHAHFLSQNPHRGPFARGGGPSLLHVEITSGRVKSCHWCKGDEIAEIYLRLPRIILNYMVTWRGVMVM